KARAEIMQYTNIFRAKVLDVTEETLVIELTGEKQKINAFISLVENYGIKRIARTGLTAMARGVKNDYFRKCFRR
ncbi:MAG: acetolactate synthase small subunit, partial [Methanobrevibacter sp.]|nr:acetolactate synthase small subunit [Methanobrevibacter sp.]